MSSDYKDYNLVVQANKFVQSSYSDLTATQIKLFDLFVSCVDTMHPKEKISIKKSEILKALNINDTNYTYIYECISKIMSSSWCFTDDKKSIYRHYIEGFDWYHEQDLVNIMFSKDIMNIIVNLKSNFLTYSVADLNCLKSRYSMLLYKYVLSYIREHQTLDFTKSVLVLKDFLRVENKYPRFNTFREKILDRFEKEVNESNALPFLIHLIVIKDGKVATAVRFLIRARTTNSEHDFFTCENEIMQEEMNVRLLKSNTPIEEVRDRQFKKIWEEQHG